MTPSRRMAGLALASSVMLSSVLSSAANAATTTSLGGITVVPAQGTDLTPFTLITERNCPVGSNVYAAISGPGFPVGGKIIVGNSPTAIYPRTVEGGVALPIADTLRTFVDQELTPTPLAGTYQLRVSCRDGAKAADLGDFNGSLHFTAPHAYVAIEPSIPAADLQLLPPLGSPTSVAPPAAHTPVAHHPTFTAAKANAPTASKSGSRWGPWLFGIGGLAFLAGIVLSLQAKRSKAVAA